MEKLIEELTKVSPDKLSKDGLKLFEKINEIIDENKALKSALNNSVSKDEIRKIINNNKPHTAQQKLQELLNKGE